MEFVDAADPGQGLVFDGRLAEDFKLSTGTWVSVGPLRARIIAQGRGLVQDVVIAGHDRNFASALVFPNLGRCRDAAGLNAEAPPADVVGHPVVRQQFQDVFDALAAESTGSSTFVTRAVILDVPPSLDAKEITDKGSINRRRAAASRGGGEDLYADTPSDRVLRSAAPHARFLFESLMTQPLTIDPAALTAIDVHVHLEHTGRHHRRRREGEGLLQGRRRRRPEALAEYYRSRKMAFVIFTVDETLTGRPALSNDEVLAFAAQHPDLADPLHQHQPESWRRGPRRGQTPAGHRTGARPEAAPADSGVLPERPGGLPALRALRRGEAAGALSHRPQRHRHRDARRRRHPLEVRASDADRRRGGGLPRHADRDGAPSFPWQDEAISVCLHKPQVYIDLSGWSPKYFSPTLIQYANSLLKHKVLFGSDYPLLTPDRWMADLEKIAIKDEVKPLIFKENAMRLFGLTSVS
jgi:hypothetical protein